MPQFVHRRGEIEMALSEPAVIRKGEQPDHERRTEQLWNTVGEPTREENVGHSTTFSAHCFHQLRERAAPAVRDEND